MNLNFGILFLLLIFLNLGKFPEIFFYFWQEVVEQKVFVNMELNSLNYQNLENKDKKTGTTQTMLMDSYH